MTLPWTPRQLDCLQAMGFDVLIHRPPTLPSGLSRVAQGADVAALVRALGIPRDIATRRAFWRALRPLRKAARRG
ncbi:MAG: hypothetical protein EPO46_05485 [Lysobacter sp.]|nr:MAG: hypothetical protein EPO46_05485 [Lysobacter sp.]